MNALFVVLALFADSARARVVVLDFTAVDLDAKIAVAVTQGITAELSRNAAYDTVSREDLAALIDVERQRQLVGRSDGSLLVQVGTLVNARFVVTGSVTALSKNALLVTAQMLDTRSGQAASRVMQRYARADELLAAVPKLAREVAAEAAELTLHNQVAGAQVFLDDKLVGTMPTAAIALRLSGRHRLRVEGPDLLPYEAEVDLEPGRTQRVRLQLERTTELEAASRARRIAAGVLVATAAVALTGATLFVREGVLSYARYRTIDATTLSQAQLDALADRTRGFIAGGVVTAGVGVAATAIAIYLLAVDPSRARLQASGLALSPSFDTRSFGLSMRGAF